MVLSNNKKLIKKIMSMKAFGIDKPPDKRSKPGFYNVNDLGFNYRSTDFQAALGYYQLTRYDKNLKARINNALIYHKYLNKKNIIIPKFSSENSYFVFQIIFKTKIKRDFIARKLKDKNYGYGILYAYPIPSLKYYKKKYNLDNTHLINSYNYSQKCLSLPCHNYLKISEIKKICNLINKNIK
jgi:dTDP-4-amino-4,6-dideoxygalactose transaminase